jgi:hypothetical protein
MLLLVVLCISVLLLVSSCAREEEATQEEATQEETTTEETAPEQQILQCQEEQATSDMSEEQREAYMRGVGQEAYSRSFSGYATVPPKDWKGPFTCRTSLLNAATTAAGQSTRREPDASN